MNRTTIMLPEALKAKAARIATKRGISLGELIREGLSQLCTSNSRKEKDAFFADSRVYTKKIPKDLSLHHDDYLY